MNNMKKLEWNALLELADAKYVAEATPRRVVAGAREQRKWSVIAAAAAALLTVAIAIVLPLSLGNDDFPATTAPPQNTAVGSEMIGDPPGAHPIYSSPTLAELYEMEPYSSLLPRNIPAELELKESLLTRDNGYGLFAESLKLTFDSENVASSLQIFIFRGRPDSGSTVFGVDVFTPEFAKRCVTGLDDESSEACVDLLCGECTVTYRYRCDDRESAETGFYEIVSSSDFFRSAKNSSSDEAVPDFAPNYDLTLDELYSVDTFADHLPRTLLPNDTLDWSYMSHDTDGRVSYLMICFKSGLRIELKMHGERVVPSGLLTPESVNEEILKVALNATDRPGFTVLHGDRITLEYSCSADTDTAALLAVVTSARYCQD